MGFDSHGVRPIGTNAVTRELWWSEAYALPLEFTTGDTKGFTRLSITHLRAGVDRSLLRPPESRFPGSRVFNLADWLERH